MRRRERVRHLRIRGKDWKIIFGRLPVNGCEGLCDFDLRTIWIRRHGRSPEDQRRAVIHEVLHALYYDMREEAVEEGEEALATALELVG